MSEFSAVEFADRLVMALDKLHMSQSRLAATLGVSRSTVTGWIRHQKLPDAYLIYHLCQALNCSADWLLGVSKSAEKQDASGAIKWVEQSLPYLSDFQREQIDFGVTMFNRLLTDSGESETNWRTAHFALQAVLHSGAIRLLEVARNAEFEQAIKDRYSILKDVIVADIPRHIDDALIRTELVAFLAATDVLGKLIRPNAVGLGSGYTILRLCEQSVPTIDQFGGTVWTPLLAFAPNNTSDYTANYLARLMSIRHPGSKALYLPHPDEAITDREAIQTMKNVQAIFVSVSGVERRAGSGNTHLLAEFRSADYLAEAPELRSSYADLAEKDRFGAEILRYLLDDNGNILSRDRAVGDQADLEILRYNSTVMGKSCIVAAQQYKAKAVLTCIKSRLTNAIVIDSEIADYLLAQRPS